LESKNTKLRVKLLSIQAKAPKRISVNSHGYYLYRYKLINKRYIFYNFIIYLFFTCNKVLPISTFNLKLKL